MRITIFTEVFLPKIDGVVTRITRTMDQLQQMGHEVQVITPGNPPQEYAGATVHRLPGFPLPVYPEITVGFIGPKTIKAIRDFQPDVIHVVNPVWSAAAGIAIAKMLKVPILGSYHTNVPEYTQSLGIGWTKPIVSAWIRMLHNRAAVNMCTSKPMVEKAEKMGIKNVQLWPKAVDTIGYHPSKSTTALRDRLTDGNLDAPLALYVGRISKEKNLASLGPIMEQVRRQLPDARLAMIGSGPDFDGLKAQLDPEYTVFTGYMSGAELQAAFASGDVFVFPSETETLGLVALESFASGVPVVGARAGGIPFVIDDGVTGFLVDPGDVSGWADRIVSLMRDEAGRAEMGVAARREAERHGWRAATKALVERYEAIS